MLIFLIWNKEKLASLHIKVLPTLLLFKIVVHSVEILKIYSQTNLTDIS